ncbi:FecR domain-containing protein [Rhodoferax sp. 4810]|uniref:FecR domain-containing protein n=1 Tax=Thiospirillum jenense TaxID=1653858 RepID=A0A839H598_9GAMM|nr:FecR family protein [Thiospirillum jenense]MBB1072955.1 FecR domain-containing protein [Rhodoferax jenense]MBB1124901.1 FecR domain-containing protein [Thiospirillum jenense]
MTHTPLLTRTRRHAVIVCVVLALGSMTPLRAAEIAGAILALTGQVSIERAGQVLPATRQQALLSGDTLAVGEGEVQVRFTDATLLTLYRHTRFAVNDYQYGAQKTNRAHFSLVNGLMRTLTGKMDKDRYRLKTRLANLAVRGTAYSLRLDSVLHIAVDAGSVAVTNAAGTVLVHAGGSAIVTTANAMPRPGGGKINLHGTDGLTSDQLQTGPPAGTKPPPPPPGSQPPPP